MGHKQSYTLSYPNSLLNLILLWKIGYCSGDSCYFYVDLGKSYNDASSYCSGNYDGKLFEPISTVDKYNQVVNGLRGKYGLTDLYGWTGIVENNGNWVYQSTGMNYLSIFSDVLVGAKVMRQCSF